MKKRIMVLLMAMTMVGGMLTGCGHEKDVVGPKNDKDVVVEENEDKAETSEEIKNETGTVEVESQAENDSTEMSLLKVLHDMSQSEELSVDGKIPVYTLKVTKADDVGVNENTMFNVVLYGPSPYMDESTITKAFLDASKSVSTATLNDIEASENVLYPADNIIDANVGFLLIHHPDTSVSGPIANAIVANKDEADEVAHLVAYFGNDIEYVNIKDAKYAIFKTETLETGTEYVYYTALHISDDIFDSGIRLFDSSYDEDINDDSLYRRISNRGGLTDCDPSVDNDTGKIKTFYTPNVDELFE